MIDIMKATDWIEQQPYIDKNRMAAAGGSYGGYMMAWLNGHTDRFKAMVCHAGVYNWHSMMASDIVGGRRALPRRLPVGGPATRSTSRSPQRFAAHFKTPTLVMHGEKDYRVPVTQGLEYYNTLRHEGRADAAGLLPGREPLDPEAAELAPLASRGLRLAGEVHRPRADELGTSSTGRASRIIQRTE